MENFKATGVSFLYLFLIFVDGMFDGNMAFLVECRNFHLSLVEQKRQPSNVLQIFTDDGWNFPLMCRGACEYEPLLQFIPPNLCNNHVAISLKADKHFVPSDILQ